MTRFPWLQRLLSAPHRLLFCAAGLQATALSVDWVWTCTARLWGSPPSVVTWPGPAHGLSMTLGVFPMFLAGFLFTAGPRWLKVSAPAARDLGAATTGIAIGWAGVLSGLHVHALAAAASLGLVTVCWSALTWRFARLCRASRVQDRLHAHGLLGAMGLIGAACGGGTIALWTGSAPGLRLAVQLGLWGGLVTAFTFAAHRLTPFFHPPAWHRLRHGLLVPLLSALLARGAALAASVLGQEWPACAHWAGTALWGAAAAAVWAAASGPELARARRAPMVRMLHRGWMWLGASLGLAALSSIPALHTRLAGLELASLHALTLGFMGTTLLAMASRVSAAHQGQAVAIDARTERLHGLLQAVVWLRLAAALWPQSAPAWTALAALGWSIVLGAWTARWVPAFARPVSARRPD